MLADVQTPLVPRAVAGSLDELLTGCTRRTPLAGTDGKSGSRLERVIIGGQPFVLKQQHPDDDWTMRGFGDVLGRPMALWACGLLDAVPSSIDHAVVGAARGLGRNGWGLALLLRDVGDHLVTEGDAVLPTEQHAQFIDHLAELSARFWEPAPGHLPELLSVESRYSAFGPGWVAAEEALGFPDAVPRIAADGWARFPHRVPAPVRDGTQALRHDLDPLVIALRRTPQTFLHGDWKLGNLGSCGDRTVLLDWSYPGIGPVLHELGWYLALNRARLPESKEATIDRLRAALEHHGVATDGWWEVQLDLCLLGALVQFGWEKALGDDGELGWWCDRARAGLRRL
jgi:hypothetical protein